MPSTADEFQVPATDEEERSHGRQEPTDSGASAVIAGEAAGSAAAGLCDVLALSLVLSAAAVLVPPRSGRPVAGLIRLYRRVFTRLTPACPSAHSCSSYALAAVTSLGPRRGLSAAAHRVRACGAGR